MKKKKGNGIKIPLPEAIIQHIQSFMSGKEAARTTLLSKSWYTAWLTCPTLDFDDRNFHGQSPRKFEEFATKTMQRYQDLSLKIESFRLRTEGYYSRTHDLIVEAMKIGATDVHIELPYSASSSLILPQEVLGSETLVSLSIDECRVDGKYQINCSRLKSLTLRIIEFKSGEDDVFKDTITCCCISLEELSLSGCSGLVLSLMNMYELHKLRRLFLDFVVVDSMFFTDFAYRFPCLKDLSILHCHGWTRIQIVTTSLETISFKQFGSSWRAKFDVPNIRKFTYSGSGLPSQLSIKGASKEWEFDISIFPDRHKSSSWFLSLTKLLTKFRLSRIISISIYLSCGLCGWSSKHEVDVDVEVVPKPLVVENLTISNASSSSLMCCALPVGLFGICRPKFITHYYWRGDNVEEYIDILCKRLMQQQQVITPNACGIPHQSLLGQFGPRKVNVEVCEMFGTEWRPLPLKKKPLDASQPQLSKRKIRFELIWD